MDPFKLLQKYREIEDPKLDSVKIKDIPICTLSKEEIIREGKELKLDLEEVALAGGIEPLPENLVKLLFFAIELRKKAVKESLKEGSSSEKSAQKRTGDEDKDEKNAKKPKSIDDLVEKVATLEKQIKEKKEVDEAKEVDKAIREAKEEASKKDVNVDILHEKLMQVDTLARRNNHASKEKVSMLLSRFHVHKQTPSFVAALVLKLLSTKDEESVLEKEQKLMKHMGIGKIKGEREESQNVNTQQPSFITPPNMYGWGWNPMGVMFPGMPTTRPPPVGYQPRSGYVRPRVRAQSPAKQACFRCQKVGHLVRDCPLNSN